MSIYDVDIVSNLVLVSKKGIKIKNRSEEYGVPTLDKEKMSCGQGLLRTWELPSYLHLYGV